MQGCNDSPGGIAGPFWVWKSISKELQVKVSHHQENQGVGQQVGGAKYVVEEGQNLVNHGEQVSFSEGPMVGEWKSPKQSDKEKYVL